MNDMSAVMAGSAPLHSASHRSVSVKYVLLSHTLHTSYTQLPSGTLIYGEYSLSGQGLGISAPVAKYPHVNTATKLTSTAR